MSVRSRLSVLVILLFSATSALFAQTPTKDDKSAMASVAGRITFNNQPLSGITVTLEAPLNIGFTNTQFRPITTKTDAQGRYRLTGIAAGYYLIWPRAMAYAMPAEGLTGRPGRTVNLVDGEQIEGLDFALVKGGVITGKITDHLGRPVIAQRVSLRRYSTDGDIVPFLSPASDISMFETDDRGIYRLFGLEAGRYLLSVGGEVAGRTNKVYPRTFYPGVRNEREAKVIEVTAGSETLNIEIKLPKPEKLYQAAGRVIDGNAGTPLAGVQLAYNLSSGANRSGPTGGTSTPTNAQGEFVLQGLVAGKYTALMRTDAESEYYADPVSFEVQESDAEGVEVKAYRSASISGSVVIEGTNDPAILKRVAEVKLDVSLQVQQIQSTFFSSQMTKPDGTFRLAGLRPGVNRILASDTGVNTTLRLARVEREGVDIKDTISLTAGERVTGLRIVMVAGSGTIRGQLAVVNGTLRPDLQILVNAIPVNAAPRMTARPVHVDARGKFVIEGLVPGEYELRPLFSFTGGTPPPSLPVYVEQRFTVSPGENFITLRLDLGEK